MNTDNGPHQPVMNKETVAPSALFGSWQFQSQQSATGVFFGVSSAGEVPVWRTELPVDLGEASEQLAEDEAQLDDSLAVLNSTPDRIDALVQRAQLASSAGISFDAASPDPLPEPDAELLDMVQTINSPAVGVSFAVGDEQQSDLETAYHQFNEDMARLLRQVANFAWVETVLSGDLVARSVVSWTGDLDTNWASGLKEEIYQLHKHSLTQALATRNIALHAVTITAHSALKLSVLLATPGGGLLALPLVWKYVKQIMADVQRYKEITKVPI
jgi:hypothetical protein